VNKTERDELRRIIRARFKVLRCDVEQRKAELHAELEASITAQFAAQDKQWADAKFLIEEAAREANRKANDVLRSLNVEDGRYDPRNEYSVISARSVDHVMPTRERAALSRQGVRDIEAKVKAALLELERREVDLLAELATTALESAEARAFMVRIPTVSELVPASRFAEIEAAFGETDSRGGAP
jgi:hypothetical protein